MRPSSFRLGLLLLWSLVLSGPAIAQTGDSIGSGRGHVAEASAGEGTGEGTDASAGERAAEVEAVVRELHRTLVEAARDAASLTREERYVRIAPVVSATHDLPYIAELTIRRQWRSVDDADRQAFVAAFERLSIMTYATRFAAVGPGTFEIYGSEEAGGGRMRVRAAIVRSDDEDIPLDYLLQQDDGRWRIVNILADGVSDLALKRAQYRKIFTDGGTIADVIAEIEEETARL